MATAPRWTGLPVLGLAALVAVALIAGKGAAVVDPGPAQSKAPPLTFFANAGQTDKSARFMARGANYAFYFTPSAVVLDLRKRDRGAALYLRFRGANPSPEIVAEHRARGRMNFIRGFERQANLATYQQLRYRNLWPGIDMVLRGQGGTLKYEFVVRPGANPRDVRLAYAGADSLALTGNGSLAIGTPLGALRDAAPRSFQGGSAVDSRYVISGSSYEFALGAYDRSRPLLIDPGLIFSTYVGGLDSDYAGDVVTSGSATFVTGETHSASFPTTPGAYDVTVDGTSDTFVTKLDASGALVYSTYLGGSQDDYNAYVAVDPGGNAYVAGVTTSSNFPTTAGAYDTSFTGPSENFVTKLNPAGTGIVYSTFFPSQVYGIEVDASGSAHLAGTAIGSFPVTAGAPDQTAVGNEAFAAKLNTGGTALDYATYIGGRGADNGLGIGLDGDGNTYVVGNTTSVEEFPFTLGAYDTNNEGENLFITKVDASGTSFGYSTLLGTGSIINPAIAVDSAGFAYLTGSGPVPTTAGAYDNGTPGGCSFATKLNQSGTDLVYSTRLGAMCNAHEIDVDSAGNAYLMQIVGQSDFFKPPVTPGAYDDKPNGYDAYVFKLNSTGTAQMYGSYLGGSSDDFPSALAAADTGAFVVVGQTQSTDFPVTASAHDQSYNGNTDGFVAKLQTYDGYPRPKGATPLRLSLVIAYKPRSCSTSQELQHGPPYAYSSCPPQKESTNATVGTGDSNGKPARMEGYLSFTTILGNPATPADEADLKIDLFVDDVFTATTLEDYPYQLRSLFTVRMTDRNTESSAMATTQDYLFPLFANCAPTPDDLEGSTCSLSTTVESIVGPGTIVEGKRSVWSIDNVRVFDSGADGDASVVGDNKVLARPGFFVP